MLSPARKIFHVQKNQPTAEFAQKTSLSEQNVANKKGEHLVEQVQSKYRKIEFTPVESVSDRTPVKQSFLKIKIIRQDEDSSKGESEAFDSERSYWVRSSEEHRFPRSIDSKQSTQRTTVLLKKSQTKQFFHLNKSGSKTYGEILHPKSQREILPNPPFDPSVPEKIFLQKCIENVSTLADLIPSKQQPKGIEQEELSERKPTSFGTTKKSIKQEVEQELEKLDPLSRYLKQKSISDKNRINRQIRANNSLNQQKTQSSQFLKHIGSQAKLASFENKITEASTLINDLLYRVNQELDQGSPSSYSKKVKLNSTKKGVVHKHSKSLPISESLPELKKNGNQLLEFEQGFNIFQNPKGYLFTDRSAISKKSLERQDEQIWRPNNSQSSSEIQFQKMLDKCDNLSRSMFENLEKCKSSRIINKKRLTSYLKKYLPGSSLLRSFLLEEFRDYPAKLKENTSPESLRQFLVGKPQSTVVTFEILQQLQSELTRLDFKLNELAMHSITQQCDQFEHDIINSCLTVEEQLKQTSIQNYDIRNENATKVVESLSFNRAGNKAHSLVGQMQQTIKNHGQLHGIGKETFQVASALETNIHKIIEARSEQIKKRYLFASAAGKYQDDL